MEEQVKILIERYSAAIQALIELLEKQDTHIIIKHSDEHPTYTEVLNSLKNCLLKNVIEGSE